MSPQPSAPENVSGFEQTIRPTPNKVCAVPLWMLQFPRPEARQLHNALRVPRKDRNKIPIPSDITNRLTAKIYRRIL
jgi:hypothetical protein